MSINDKNGKLLVIHLSVNACIVKLTDFILADSHLNNAPLPEGQLADTLVASLTPHNGEVDFGL